MLATDRKFGNGERQAQKVGKIAGHGPGKPLRGCQNGQRTCVLQHGKAGGNPKAKKRGSLPQACKTIKRLPAA